MKKYLDFIKKDFTAKDAGYICLIIGAGMIAYGVGYSKGYKNGGSR